MSPVTIQRLERCPLRPERRTIRAALAAVYDLDVPVDHEQPIELGQGVVVLVYKMLLDVGIEQDYVVDLLRHYRYLIERWPFPRQLILSINDNRFATLIGTDDTDAYDFKAGTAADATKLPAPLLQASVNLAGLSALIA